jgi:hypothetical protein
MTKTMPARYPGKCSRTGARINPGDTIIYNTATRRAELQPDADTITFYGEHGPQHFIRNRAGRCEDAPCCGCCTI